MELTSRDIEHIEADIGSTYDFNGGELVAQLLKEWRAMKAALEQLGIELVDE